MVSEEEAADVAIIQSLVILLRTLRYCVGVSGGPGPLVHLRGRLWRALIVVVFGLNSDYECGRFLSRLRHRRAFFVEEVLV